MFSAKHSLAEIKECNLKQKFTKTWGVFAYMQKGVLFCFLLFGGFIKNVCLEKAPERLFSCNFRVFFLFVSPKGLSLKSFFSSYSVFFSGFPFVFPFKSPFFLCFLSISPVLENTIIFGCFYLPFLLFPFLMFACSFNQTFLKSHF